MPKSVTLRRLIVWLHLWTGLLVGAVVAVLGLSGSAIVFHSEIDRWLNPTLLTAPSTSGYMDVDATRADITEVAETAADTYPWGVPRFVMVHFPRHATGVHRVLLKGGFGPDDGDWYEAMVDPASGALLGHRRPSESVIGFLINLHANFLIGDGSWGEVFVGVMGGMVLPVFLATGVWLWWPSIGRVASAFRIRARRGAYLLLRDLHKVGGVFAVLLLVLPILTGLVLVFPDQLRPPVETVLPHHEPQPLPTVSFAGGQALIGAGNAVAAAEAVHPNAVATSVNLPAPDGGVYSVRLRRDGEPRQHYVDGRLYVAVHPHTGEIVASRDDLVRPIASKLLDVWLFPSHTGEIFGLFGRWMVFAAGLAPAALFCTGLVTWIVRRRLRSVRAR